MQPSASVHALLQSVEPLQSSEHRPSSQLTMLQLALALHAISQKPLAHRTVQSLSASQVTEQPPPSQSKSHVAPASQSKTQRSPSQR